MKEGGALYFVFRESRSPGCSPSRTRAVRSDFLVRPAPFSPLVLYGALSSSHQLLALRASVSGLTFSPLVLYGALSSSHQLLALRASVSGLTYSPLVLYGALSSLHQLLPLRASVNGLTYSPLVLYGALSSSHQHRSVQIPLKKKIRGGWDLNPRYRVSTIQRISNPPH